MAARGAGGLGVAQVMFLVTCGYTMFRMGQYELAEPLSSAPAVPGWEELVRGVANGELEPADIVRFTPSGGAAATDDNAGETLLVDMCDMHM